MKVKDLLPLVPKFSNGRYNVTIRYKNGYVDSYTYCTVYNSDPHPFNSVAEVLDEEVEKISNGYQDDFSLQIFLATERFLVSK